MSFIKFYSQKIREDFGSGNARQSLTPLLCLLGKSSHLINYAKKHDTRSDFARSKDCTVNA